MKSKTIEKIVEESPDILLKDGTKQKILYPYNKEDIIGIVLDSGRIISTRIVKLEGPFSPTPFTGYPGKRMFEEFDDARKDYDGQANTDFLNLFCNVPLITDVLKQNEYIPGVAELEDLLKESKKIEYIRGLLNLPSPLKHSWLISSTIKSEEFYYAVFNSTLSFSGYNDVRKDVWLIPFIYEV